MRHSRMHTPVHGLLLAAALLLVGCTSSGTSTPGPITSATSPSTSRSASPSPTSEVRPTTTLADGSALPASCRFRRLTADQTVAFAASGGVWALDPTSGRLSCALEASDPGPFLWGPLGDRVVLGGFRVAGLGSSPSYDLTAASPQVADWGHPIGIAIVFAERGATVPRKFLLDNHKIQKLGSMPKARYLDVAYHPSGLALAWVLERGGRQEIWFSTNEGTDPKRLVFSVQGTAFSDVSFTHDGESLVYVANHAQGYAEIHTIDLADPTTLHSVWKGSKGDLIQSVSLSPTDGRMVATEGTSCQDSRAVQLVHERQVRLSLPGAHRPTTTLGWLDAHTYLVGAGGCGAPMDLYTASTKVGTAPTLLVKGVDAAASRAAAPPAPTSLPKEVQLDTGSGVG
jgi:hypothetical protein